MALFLSAVLCVTATPVTGMAAEFSNDTAAAETSEKDMNEESEEIPEQEETGEDISDVTMLFINRHPEYYWLSF